MLSKKDDLTNVISKKVKSLKKNKALSYGEQRCEMCAFIKSEYSQELTVETVINRLNHIEYVVASVQTSYLSIMLALLTSFIFFCAEEGTRKLNFGSFLSVPSSARVEDFIIKMVIYVVLVLVLFLIIFIAIVRIIKAEVSNRKNDDYYRTNHYEIELINQKLREQVKDVVQTPSKMIKSRLSYCRGARRCRPGNTRRKKR